jgi:hypothetical protein
MPNFAVIREGVVYNIIVAETLEIAESVTGHTCVEADELTRISDIYVDGKIIRSTEEDAPGLESPTE